MKSLRRSQNTVLCVNDVVIEYVRRAKCRVIHFFCTLHSENKAMIRKLYVCPLGREECIIFSLHGIIEHFSESSENLRSTNALRFRYRLTNIL